MPNTRKNKVIPNDHFWAIDRKTGKRADQTGHCICIENTPWAIYAIDIVGCEREFLHHKFYFEVIN